MRTRLTGKRGYTFIEAIVSMLVLGLVSSLIVTGMNAITAAHRQQQFASQAVSLATALDNALSKPLRLVSTDSEGRVVLTYKGRTFTGADNTSLPQLIVKVISADDAAGQQGHLYLRGRSVQGNGSVASSASQTPLLNEGLYGDCRIARSDEGDFLTYHKDNGGRIVGVSLDFKVVDGANPAMFSEYHYYYAVAGAD